MPRRIIIDCDPGIDDAVALCVGLFCPDLDVVAITAVEGNVPADMSSTNVQTIVERLDPPKIPRIGCATANDNPDYRDARFVHGKDGLGEVGFVTSSHHQRRPSEKIICDETKADPGQISILCLGPLTNIARALNRDPTFAENVDQIMMMGGSVKGVGNITPTAEFNMYCDPESAQQVFEAPIRKKLIPLDITMQVHFTLDFLRDLPDEPSSIGRLLKKILPHLFRSYHQNLGQESIHIHDVIAVLQLIEPELFEFVPMAGKVEVEGSLTRGATIFDQRMNRQWEENIEVARVVDVTAVKQAVVKHLNPEIDF
ncbi:MAG: nucleoside hydrolase [Planctomycetota bacterium]|nr:nucleoside hydrolase [Planctomycetota bacterium]